MGIISKILSWVDFEPESNVTTLDWFAGLVLIVLVSLLWSHVILQVVE